MSFRYQIDWNEYTAVMVLGFLVFIPVMILIGIVEVMLPGAAVPYYHMLMDFCMFTIIPTFCCFTAACIGFSIKDDDGIVEIEKYPKSQVIKLLVMAFFWPSLLLGLLYEFFKAISGHVSNPYRVVLTRLIEEKKENSDVEV